MPFDGGEFAQAPQPELLSPEASGSFARLRAWLPGSCPRGPREHAARSLSPGWSGRTAEASAVQLLQAARALIEDEGA